MAHHMKPVVMIGKKGISSALISEIIFALETHELIKVQFASKVKEDLDTSLKEIIRETEAVHIDTIGNIVILFRKKEENSRYDL